MTVVLDTATVTELAAAVTGPVREPGDDGYAAEVASFNLAHAAAPAVVVGATGAEDVAAAVRWAARAGLRVSVQATGHGLLAELPDRERRILQLRFFDDLTQTEIAALTGISQMHVSRLLSRTLGMLRTQLAQEA